MNWRTLFFLSMSGILLSAPSPVSAQTPITVIGVGNSTCEVWRDPAKAGMKDHSAASSWVAGYVFGVAHELDFDLLKDQTRVSVDAAVDYYCSQHPTDRVVDAAEYLGGALKKRAGKDAPRDLYHRY